jgi:hypothetical protein
LLVGLLYLTTGNFKLALTTHVYASCGESLCTRAPVCESREQSWSDCQRYVVGSRGIWFATKGLAQNQNGEIEEEKAMCVDCFALYFFRLTRKLVALEAHTLVPPLSRSPSPDLLPSDDEGAPKVIPITLRSLPQCFPGLPPKHTYLRTPVCQLSIYALNLILRVALRHLHRRNKHSLPWRRNSKRQAWSRNH